MMASSRLPIREKDKHKWWWTQTIQSTDIKWWQWHRAPATTVTSLWGEINQSFPFRNSDQFHTFHVLSNPMVKHGNTAALRTTREQFELWFTASIATTITTTHPHQHPTLLLLMSFCSSSAHHHNNNNNAIRIIFDTISPAEICLNLERPHELNHYTLIFEHTAHTPRERLYIENVILFIHLFIEL